MTFIGYLFIVAGVILILDGLVKGKLGQLFETCCWAMAYKITGRPETRKEVEEIPLWMEDGLLRLAGTVNQAGMTVAELDQVFKSMAQSKRDDDAI